MRRCEPDGRLIDAHRADAVSVGMPAVELRPLHSTAVATKSACMRRWMRARRLPWCARRAIRYAAVGRTRCVAMAQATKRRILGLSASCCFRERACRPLSSPNLPQKRALRIDRCDEAAANMPTAIVPVIGRSCGRNTTSAPHTPPALPSPPVPPVGPTGSDFSAKDEQGDDRHGRHAHHPKRHSSFRPAPSSSARRRLSRATAWW
jgi:hypothetical protein